MARNWSVSEYLCDLLVMWYVGLFVCKHVIVKLGIKVCNKWEMVYFTTIDA